jgi:1-acyl-sn-glycerol-3-phosphate acyltransferase
MKLIRAIHTGYGLVVFVLLFGILLPLLFIPILFPKQYHLIGWVNRWWARLLFMFVFLPFSVEYRKKLDKKQQYVFCPNHFSYIDIPAMGLNHHNSIFVGKSDMENIPLFGYMYRKLHITVNRSSLKSRFNTLKRSMAAVDEGKSLVIFPEGGIVTEKDPVMARFKDGAFRVAIEKQIPLVPVTIPYNWIILPPDQFLLRWHPLKVIFHEPVITTGLTMDNLDALKQQVFEILNQELDKHLKTTKK